MKKIILYLIVLTILSSLTNAVIYGSADFETSPDGSKWELHTTGCYDGNCIEQQNMANGGTYAFYYDFGKNLNNTINPITFYTKLTDEGSSSTYALMSNPDNTPAYLEKAIDVMYVPPNVNKVFGGYRDTGYEHSSVPYEFDNWYKVVVWVDYPNEKYNATFYNATNNDYIGIWNTNFHHSEDVRYFYSWSDGSYNTNGAWLDKLYLGEPETPHGIYQDLQGWCPTVDGTLSNISLEITQTVTGEVLFRHNSTNSSLSTSNWINLTTNGTNNVDLGYSANDCIYYEFSLFDTSGSTTPEITSYTINEIDVQHIIKALVQDTSANPIPNATVIIVNELDNLVYGNYTTNLSGQIAVDIGYSGNFSVLAYNSSNDVNGSMVAHVEVTAS